jgi:hypothetical protein
LTLSTRLRRPSVAVSVLAARGVNGILGARFATGLCRESNLTSPTTNTSTNGPQSSRPHRNAPLSCKAEGIADTRTELIGHLDGRSPNTLKHNMITAHFVMDNDDYPCAVSQCRMLCWTTSLSEGDGASTVHASNVSSECGVYRPERLGLVAVTSFPREADVVAAAVL